MRKVSPLRRELMEHREFRLAHYAIPQDSSVFSVPPW